MRSYGNTGTITIALTGMKTTSTYALQMNLAPRLGYANVGTFTIKKGTTTLWDVNVPNAFDYTTIQTASFQPTSTSNSFVITYTSCMYNGLKSGTSGYLLIDNVCLVENPIVPTATDLISPVVNKVYSVPGGKFDTFGTSTGYMAITDQLGRGNWAFHYWSNNYDSGIINVSTFANCPTPPSGSAYIGSTRCNAFSKSALYVEVYGLNTTKTYSISLNIAGYNDSTAYAMPSSFSIYIQTWKNNITQFMSYTTVYTTTTISTSFASITSSTFVPASSTLKIYFEGKSNSSKNFRLLYDDIKLNVLT
jgi:hypothetical protein